MPATLRMTTPPATPAVALALAKAQCRVDWAADDALLTRLLAGACADAGAECGWGFGVASYKLTFDGPPAGWVPPCDSMGWPGPVRLGVRPVVSVEAVRYYDPAGVLTTLSPSAYWLGGESGRLAPAAGTWPVTQAGRPEAVAVEFTAGLTAVPPQGVDAVLLIVGDRYAHRGDGEADRRAVPDAARRLLWQLHSGEVA